MDNSANELANELNKIINIYLTNDKINELIKDTGKRINKSVVTINDAILYFFYSVFDGVKKSDATFFTNEDINKDTHRTSYSRKEKKIPVEIYQLIEKKICDLCSSYIKTNCSNNNQLIHMAGDGSNCTDDNYEVSLSMGFYDVTNDIPVEFILEGSENRNQEIKCTTEYIKNNPNKFDGVILILDRAYFAYDFIEFLIDNNIKHIIRVKGNGNNLNEIFEIGKNMSKNNKEQILKLRRKVKIINYNGTLRKTITTKGNIYPNKTSKKKKLLKNTKTSKKFVNKYVPTTYVFDTKNDYVFVTNLLEHTDDEIKKIYDSRWEVELFFKLIKNNFDIQIFKRRKRDEMTKVHSCIMILTSLMKLIKKRVLTRTKLTNIINKHNGKKVECKSTINESELLRRIKDKIIFPLLMGKMTGEIITNFEKKYCKIIKTEKGRQYVRESKTPFTKWYVKAYSCNSEIVKILRAIETNTVYKLHPNKQTRAKNITIIESTPCGD